MIGQLSLRALAADLIGTVVDTPSGNGDPIGCIKLVTGNGWFAGTP